MNGLKRGEMAAIASGTKLGKSVFQAVKTPKLVPHTEWCDLYTEEEFKAYRSVGAIIPSDGCGNWGTEDGFSDNHDCFGPKPDWATHVAWFNK